MLGRREEEGSLTKRQRHARDSRIAGVGLGLRWEFIDELVEQLPEAIDFLEVSPENYMGRGGHFPALLARAAASYPIVTHGLTMSLGGVDALDPSYMRELRAFIHEVKSPWHSDHLCFGASAGRVMHDLLPIAFTQEAVDRVADRVKRAQDALGVPMAIENISFYMHPGKAQMSEAEFVARVCEKADCGLMLDVNNAYVNATNFNFDPKAWMDTVPLDRVVQIHVAGHERFDEGVETVILDTHGADVPDPVFELLAYVLPRTGPVPVVLERDQAIPPLAGLLTEIAKIKAICASAGSG